jgi:hypothetical protein
MSGNPILSRENRFDHAVFQAGFCASHPQDSGLRFLWEHSRELDPFQCEYWLKIVSSHCQQKRQQWCSEGASFGSGGIVIDSSIKSGIFNAETTL